MGAQGLYLNRWSLNFNLIYDVPSTVLILVKLDFLPLHFWNHATFKSIGNSLFKYINYVEPQEGMFSCVRIYVKVDLDTGFLGTINLNMDNWSHIQEVNYDQIPFKCKAFHEYRHFV